MEFSIPARFAFMFLMLIIANKEWCKLDNAQNMTWTDIIIASGVIALCTFIAGIFLYEALIDILAQTATG